MSIKVKHCSQFELLAEGEVKNGLSPNDIIPEGKFPMCIVNGEAWLQKEWDNPLPDDAEVMLIPVVAGPAGFVAFVAIIQVVAFVAAGVAGVYGIAWLARTLNAFVNADEDTANANFANAQASPTYNAAFRRNSIRLNQGIPIIYGTMRAYPDVCARPYFTFEESTDSEGDPIDKEYVHVLLCIGHGNFNYDFRDGSTTDIDVRMGDTSIYDIGTGVVDGAINNNANHATMLAWYDTDMAPVRDFSPAEFTFEGTQPGHQRYNNTPGYVPDNWMGPYVINRSGTANQINQFWLDFNAPNGLYWRDTFGRGELFPHPVPIYAQIREIDDQGDPVSGATWTNIAPDNESVSFPDGLDVNERSATSSADWQFASGPFPAGGYLMQPRTLARKGGVTQSKSRSVRYTLPKSGRFQVRCRAGRYTSEHVNGIPRWYGIRGVRATQPTYQTRFRYIALKIEATDETANTRDKINLIVHRRLGNFSAQGGSPLAPQRTRSISRAFYDLATNSDYGLGFTDDQIDLDTLVAEGAFWDANNKFCDGTFDRRKGAWEALSQVLLPGRATPILQNGELTLVRDKPRPDVAAVYSKRNIDKGSLIIEARLPGDEIHDGIRGSFLNRDTWDDDEILFKVGGGTPANPQKVDLWGITTQANAQAEVEHMAKALKYRDTKIKFGGEMATFIPQFGEKIAVQDELIDLEAAHHTYVTGITGQTTIVLHRAVPATIAANLKALIRNLDGSGIEADCALGADRRHLTLTGFTLASSDAGQSITLVKSPDRVKIQYGSDFQLATRISVGVGNAVSNFYSVSRISPQSLWRGQIEAVNYDERVYM